DVRRAIRTDRDAIGAVNLGQYLRRLHAARQFQNLVLAAQVERSASIGRHAADASVRQLNQLRHLARFGINAEYPVDIRLIRHPPDNEQLAFARKRNGLTVRQVIGTVEDRAPAVRGDLRQAKVAAPWGVRAALVIHNDAAGSRSMALGTRRHDVAYDSRP